MKRSQLRLLNQMVGLFIQIHLQPKEIGVVYEATAIKNNKEQKIEISATDGKVIFI